MESMRDCWDGSKSKRNYSNGHQRLQTDWKRSLTMAPDAKEKNTYLNDPESGAEMMRLLDQDHTLTTCMGGVWPEQHNPDAIQDVLDIACGPGGCVQEIAFIYPAIQITGIDISQAMIEYATMQARVQHLDNAHFHVMDWTRQLA